MTSLGLSVAFCNFLWLIIGSCSPAHAFKARGHSRNRDARRLRKAPPVWHHEQYIGALEQELLHAVRRHLEHRDSLPLVGARRKRLSGSIDA
jgi:hypothetical protein